MDKSIKVTVEDDFADPQEYRDVIERLATDYVAWSMTPGVDSAVQGRDED